MTSRKPRLRSAGTQRSAPALPRTLPRRWMAVLALGFSAQAAAASPVTYELDFDGSLGGPAGTGQLVWDAATGIMSRFTWDFGAPGQGGITKAALESPSFGTGSDATYGAFLWSVLTASGPCLPATPPGASCELELPAASLIAGTTPAGDADFLSYGSGNPVQYGFGTYGSPSLAGYVTFAQAAAVNAIYGYTDPALGFRPMPGELAPAPGGVLIGISASGLTENGTYVPGGLFELVPPLAGHRPWTAKLLLSVPHYFAFDQPSVGPLLIDKDGNVFGEANGGPSGNGEVFEFSPPNATSAHWTFHVICTFGNYRDGVMPSGGLSSDANGVLYGTTQGGGSNEAGVVFSLTPPVTAGGKWTDKVLWRFQGGTDGVTPYGPPVVGPKGELYGVTGYGGAHGNGRVYELTPPAAGGSVWTETVLHDFSSATDGQTPTGGLVRDAKGTLYGIASDDGPGGFGAAFALVPPSADATAWSFKLLHAFIGAPDAYSPENRLVLRSDGSLIGLSTYGGSDSNSFDGLGAIFKLTPPAAGKTAWTEKILYSFGFDAADVGYLPIYGLVQSGDVLYGSTIDGGTNGNGAVFELTP